MDLKLKNKVALVSGGAKGIGAACVRLFREEGASVIVADLDESAGRTIAEGDEHILFVQADLSDPDACGRVVQEGLARFSRIDALVNNAGVNDAVGLDQPPEQFLESIHRNLLPAYSLTHHAAKALRESRGSIVNLGSKVAVTGQGGTSGYAAAKGGINALTREWAAAFCGDGVRVNAVLPAECDTDQYQKWLASVDDPQGTRKAIENLVPLGRRMTTPKELAAMVVFLASPISSHTTGQIVFVDGGYTHLDRALTSPHKKWD